MPRAPHAWHCRSFAFNPLQLTPPGSYRADDGLASRADVDVLNQNPLLATMPQSLEGEQRLLVGELGDQHDDVGRVTNVEPAVPGSTVAVRSSVAESAAASAPIVHSPVPGA